MGARSSASRAVSSGSARSRSYAALTKRQVVSMPFQSTRSLKQARRLKSIETKNRTVQRGSMSTLSASRSRGKLQHSFARPDQPKLLPGDLLDRLGVAPEAIDRAREVFGLPAQGDDLTLERLHFPLHLPDPDEPARAVGDERQRQHGDGRAHDPRVHRGGRVKRPRPGQDAAWPSSSSMRRSCLYLAVRSPRASEPALIW